MLPDGIGVVYSAKILGTPLKERVAGFDFACDMLEELDELGGRLYLLGAKPGVAEEEGRRDRGTASQDRVCAAPRWLLSKESDPVAQGSGSPPGPICCSSAWAPPSRRSGSPASACSPGPSWPSAWAALDVFADNVERAPEQWQKLRMEWAYRLGEGAQALWPHGQAAPWCWSRPPGTAGPAAVRGSVMAGLLIVFEGTDGSGKSTQFRALCRRVTQSRPQGFPEAGLSPVQRALLRPDPDVPGGGEFGSHPEDVNPYAASAFYAVDRYASFKKSVGEFYSVRRAGPHRPLHHLQRRPPGGEVCPQERDAFSALAGRF